MTGLEFLFHAYTLDTDECVLWPFCKNDKGYGRLTALGRKGRRAHVLAHELFNGLLPFGQVVLHSCDNPGCVNPKHLSAGTVADNQKEMKARGRARNQNRLASKEEIQQIIELRLSGLTQMEIAATVGRSQAFVSSTIRNNHDSA